MWVTDSHIPGFRQNFFDGEASYFESNYRSFFFTLRIKTCISSRAPNRKLQLTTRFIGHCRISCGSSVWDYIALLAPGIWRWPFVTPTWLSFLVGTFVALQQGRTTRLKQAKDRHTAKQGNKHYAQTPGCQIVRATKFCGSTLWNLPHVTLLAPACWGVS